MSILSVKSILVRYGLATLLIWLAVLVRQPDAFYFAIFAAVVSIKFLVYDGVTYFIRRKWPIFRASPGLIVGYSVTLVLDVLATWASASGETDAGFGFLVTIFYTPWILAGALVAMVVHSLVVSKKR